MLKYASFLYTNELETVVALGLKAFEYANYETRICVSKLIANLLFKAINVEEAAKTYLQSGQMQLPQNIEPSSSYNVKTEYVFMNKKLDTMLSLLSNAFSKSKSKFFKSNRNDEMKNAFLLANREVRMGITYAYIELINLLGSKRFEDYFSICINSLMDFLNQNKGLFQNNDIVYSRKCVSYILRVTISTMLNENAQINAAKELTIMIKKHISLYHPGTLRNIFLSTYLFEDLVFMFRIFKKSFFYETCLIFVFYFI